MALRKLDGGCEDCAASYISLARASGASADQIREAIEKSDVPERRGIDRRTVLKFFGLTGAAVIADSIFGAQPAGAVTVTYWGVDSAAHTNETRSACGSTVLAARIVSNLGTPNFWGRYFEPAFFPFVSGEAITLKNQGINHILPLTFPAQSRLGATGSQGTSFGQADGNQACQTITNWIGNNTGNMRWPSTDGMVAVWLDVESGTSLSANYWAAWSTAVATFTVTTNPLDSTPFLPGVYLNPNNAGICARVNGGAHPAYGVWTTQPQDNPPTCPSTKPNWNGTNCSGSTTIFWQHALGRNFPASCKLWYCNDTNYGVDLDALNPARNSIDINRMIRVPL